MVKIADDEYYCNRCQSSALVEEEDLQKVQELPEPETLDSVEPAVVSIDYNLEEQVRIKKEPELRGGFKVLRDRGLKITSYYDSSAAKENAD